MGVGVRGKAACPGRGAVFIHVHAKDDKLQTGSGLIEGVVLAYVEDWHSVQGGQSQAGAGVGGGTCC